MFIDQPSYHGGRGYLAFRTDDIDSGDWRSVPSAELPMLSLVPMGVGDVLELAGKRIEVLPAEHTVPAVGFVRRTG